MKTVILPVSVDWIVSCVGCMVRMLMDTVRLPRFTTIMGLLNLYSIVPQKRTYRNRL